MKNKKKKLNTHEKTRKEENYENGFDEIKTSIHLGATALHLWIAREHKQRMIWQMAAKEPTIASK